MEQVEQWNKGSNKCEYAEKRAEGANRERVRVITLPCNESARVSRL